MSKTPVKKVPDTKAISFIVTLLMLLALTALVIACAPSTADTSGQNGGNTGNAETGKDSNSPEIPANDDPYAVSFTWDATADCSVCHEKETDSVADAATTAGFHTTQGLNCSSCHADSNAMSTVHEKVTSASKTPIRLRSTKVEQATCLNCHESLENLAQKSAGSIVLTDSKGTVINPHALPENSDHAIISCVSCHEAHTGQALEKTAKNTCISCHHEDVFECNTCHKI